MDSKHVEHQPTSELREKTWLKVFDGASDEELSRSTVVRSRKLQGGRGTIHFIISKPEPAENVRPLDTYRQLRIEIDSPDMYAIRARISTEPEATLSQGLPEREKGVLVFSKWLKPRHDMVNPPNPFDVPIPKTQKLEIEVSKTKPITKGKQSDGRMPFSW